MTLEVEQDADYEYFQHYSILEDDNEVKNNESENHIKEDVSNFKKLRA